MSYPKTLLAAGALLSFATLCAEASLTAGIAGGQSVVYSSVSNISWTGDANLLGTLESTLGYSTVVSAIITVSPKIPDTANAFDTPANSGYHDVSGSDFSGGGYVSWFGAQAFTGYLNSISYAGSSQWALPSAGADPQYGYNQTGGQFGQLYYNELNALAYPYPGTNGSDFGILHDGQYRTSGNTGPFANAQTFAYWLGTEYAPGPLSAWFFNTYNGHQYVINKYSQIYAWVVSPGNVAAVPVPGSIWLFGSGLLALLGLKWRGNIG